MGEDKVYPLQGYIEVGSHRIHVKFFSEKDERIARDAARTIKKELKGLMDGYDDSIDECTAMLALKLMIENNELKSKLDYSIDRINLVNINQALDQIDELDNLNFDKE